MQTRATIRTHYLIIGNSAGGIGAAEAIREVDKTNSITVVSDEPYPAYSRPLISKYLAGERTVDEILFRPVDFYSSKNIELISGLKVLNLDLKDRTAHTENSKQIIWDKLLLATGGVPVVPEMKGGDKEGVFTFQTMKDATAIRQYVKDGFHAVVIGGGLIGISATEALVKRGVNVTVIVRRERILNRLLDATASSIVEKTLRNAGVTVVTNRTVAEVIGEKKAEGVILDSGERIPCNLVIVAFGVRPRTELATGTAIRVNHGILVDRLMCTSYPDVYACGDAAEAYDFVYDANRVIPIWPNAYIGGRIAGYNMAGIRTEYAGGTTMNSLNYFGLDIVTAGAVAPLPDRQCEVLSQRNDGGYKKIILSNDLVIGMVFVRDIEKCGIVFSLMKNKVNVAKFKQLLLADDFGLAYLPRKLWQERLGKATAPINSK